jgi:hypothetical protein
MKYTVHCNVIEMKLIYICIYKQKAPVDFLHFDFLVWHYYDETLHSKMNCEVLRIASEFIPLILRASPKVIKTGISNMQR